jgi:hypothetical protein
LWSIAGKILPQGLVKKQYTLMVPQSFISNGFRVLLDAARSSPAQPESPGVSALWYDSPSWGDGELATIARLTRQQLAGGRSQFAALRVTQFRARWAQISGMDQNPGLANG